jgi:hypothetical protein
LYRVGRLAANEIYENRVEILNNGWGAKLSPPIEKTTGRDVFGRSL